MPALALLLMVPSAGSASTGPTTPSFVLAWGDSGAAPTQFVYPSSVATDALGNVYVADTYNHRIQKFDRLGNMLTQWGSYGFGSGQFRFPEGVATDAAGNVYVADTGVSRIQKFTGDGVFLTRWGQFSYNGNGGFQAPAGVAVDAAGNVYVVDRVSNFVQKFTGAGAFLTQWGGFGGAGDQFYFPAGVAVDPAGNVYIADQFNHRIKKFDPQGTFLAAWGIPGGGNGNGQFYYPYGVATDRVGNVYVADRANHRIQKLTGTGAYLTQWGINGSGNGQFNAPTAIAADAAGNIYVSDPSNHRIQKFSGAGVALSEPPPTYLLGWGETNPIVPLWSPAGVATSAAGNVYVADRSYHRIREFSGTGALIAQWGTGGSGNGEFTRPSGVALDPAGNVFVADTDNHRIQKFSGAGTYLTQWGGQGTGNGQLDSPYGVATDAAGNVYVADTGNHRVQKFSGAGAYLTQWGTSGTGSGQFSFPTSVVADAAGNVYVTDLGNHRVQKFGGTGAYITQWGANGSGNGQFSLPAAVTVDPAGNVYVTDQGNHRIQKFTSFGTYLTQWGANGSGETQFFSPFGVTTDAAGNIYVADQGNHRVKKFVAPATVALVSDVRNDQGRSAQIRFLRSSADAPGVGVTIPRYEIYRRNDPLPQPAGVSRDAVALAACPSNPSLDLAGWTYLMTAPAHGETEYHVVVPTLVDATAASLEYSAYMVRAATSSPFTSYDSGVENGYSVDNLAPPTPTPFLAAYLSGGTHLHWGVSPASDFATFRLHRGSAADFVPGPGTLVTSLPDTGYVDVGPAGSFYKLSAVDASGNESAFALVGPFQTTDTPAASMVGFALDGVCPNPAFGRRMLVHFALPIDAPATLELLDVAGRRVRERAVGSLGAGRHVVDLGGTLKPGLYFMRLTQGVNQRVARATLVD